ncbi:MAG: sensor histidine kinase [Limisphaerales bacterium]
MWPTFAITASLIAIALLFGWRRDRARLLREMERLKREGDEARKRVEWKLSNFTAEQQAMFNSMIEGLLLLDADGNVRLTNEAFEDQFNLRQNLKGRSLMEAVRFHEIQEVYNRTLIDSVVQGHEMELPAIDQRVLQVNSAVVLDGKGGRRGMILVFHDITRVKELENTRREFVANVSHELRTPLSLIKGYVETLIDGAKEEAELRDKFLHTIDKHADRLTFLIEDLLTLSHLESGTLMMNMQPTRLREAVDRVCDDLSKRAAEKEIDLINSVSDDLVVQADSDRLEQVLFNLLDNGIKYGREAGDVRVTADEGQNGRVEVRVEDDGPGIPDEAQERLFERFFRVDKARSREQGGTGLGLAIVKHIVQSHGGEMWVESQMGHGTSFYFSLSKE